MNQDEKWMEIALKEAIKAKKEDEVPVGAILVKNGMLIAKAHNQPISKNDATAHAEIQLIRNGGIKQKPVGLVYIGIKVGNKVIINKSNFKNRGRIFIQKQTVKKSLNLLLKLVK